MSGFLSKGKAKFHQHKDKLPGKDKLDKLSSSEKFSKLPGRDRWNNFLEDWKRKSPEERAAERDALNTETMLTKAQEMTEDNVRDLEVSDFFIARLVKNKEEEKYHDHFAFVKEKDSEGVKVIFISDIMKDKPEEATWTFETLRTNMREGQLEIIKFDFMDLQDEDELILERAEAYKLPKTEVRPLHFAYLCVFGVKEPVFSEDHLSLCDDKTLLLLRTEDEDTLVLLHKARKGKFTVSLKESDSDIKVLSYMELMNMTSGTMSGLYYYPGLKMESLEEVYKDDHSKKKDAAHSTVEVAGLHAVEHGVVHLLAPELGKALAGSAGHMVGGGLHAFIAVAGASVSTHKAGKKEKDYKASGGTKGFSRTRRNKEVSAAWTGAGVGTAGSIAGSLGAATGAAIIGQVLIPVPGVGAAVGVAVAGVAGGVVGGLTSSYASKKASNKIFDKNMQRKCPLC